MSLIRQFEHNGKVYRHLLDIKDDSIVLMDEDHSELLEYSNKCKVVDIKSNKDLGRFVLENGYWVFKKEDDSIVMTIFTIDMVEGLLDAEVAISRIWLNDQI